MRGSLCFCLLGRPWTVEYHYGCDRVMVPGDILWFLDIGPLRIWRTVGA